MFGQVRTFGVNIIPERKKYICTIEKRGGDVNTFVWFPIDALLGNSSGLLKHSLLVLTESDDSGCDLHVNVSR